MRSLIDEALEDFPLSEMWRVQTDGWQAKRGPANFRPEFYAGMDAGFQCLRQHNQALVTTQLIEEIYHSMYQSEKNYATDGISSQGYGTRAGSFEIFLPEPGLEAESGITEAGIQELKQNLQEIVQAKGDRKFPFVEVSIERLNQLTLFLNPFDEHFDKNILQYLRQASWGKHAYKGPNKLTSDTELATVSLFRSASNREILIQYIQKDIDNYYKELLVAKKIDDEDTRNIAVLNCINRFIRKLHQSHYFTDGNGRTFVFLLHNLLLLQNGFGLKITENPAHFAAYSLKELLVETQNDLLRFQAFKITAAKDFLQGIHKEDICKKPMQLKEALFAHLSLDPLIAMAQINELYIRINSNQLLVPKGYTAPSSGFMRLFDTADAEMHAAHQDIQRLLKDMYAEKLHQLVYEDSKMDQNLKIGFGSKQDPETILSDILNRHAISKTMDPALIDIAFEILTTQPPTISR